MTALTKNTFTFPNFGSMLHALNNGSAKKAGTAQSTDGVLVPCQWDSLSDVRRHRPSKYVHQIRLMNYTPPNSDELGWWFLGFNTESDKIVFRRFGLSPGSCPFLFFVSFLSGGRRPNDQ